MGATATRPAQGHPSQPATPRVAPRARPAPSRVGPEPYLAFGDPEAHVGFHAGGSAAAPRRAARAWPPGPAPLPGAFVVVGEAAASRPRAEEEPRGAPRPGARPLSPVPGPRTRCSVSPRASAPGASCPLLSPAGSCMPAARCPRLQAPGGPRTRCSRPWGPARQLLLGVLTFPRLQVPRLYPQSLRTHCSYDSSSPIDQVTVLLHP